MDYYSDIVEDDSTLVINNYDNYGDIEEDSLDAKSDANDSTVVAMPEKDADKGYMNVIDNLYEAEELVLNILARKHPNSKAALEQKKKQTKSSSAPTTPVRPSSAGALRSSRSRTNNVNSVHRMLSAYGVTAPRSVESAPRVDNYNYNNNAGNKVSDEIIEKTRNAFRSVPTTPTKSSILAWSDTYSIDSKDRIGYSNAYDYHYHHHAMPVAAEELIHNDAIENNAQLAIKRINAKNHIQRSTSDNAMKRRNSGSSHSSSGGASYLLNNFQIQSFDIDDSPANYLLYSTVDVSGNNDNNDTIGDKEERKLLKSNSNNKRRIKSQQHKLVFRIEQTLIDELPTATEVSAKNSLPKKESATSSVDTLQDMVDFVVADAFSLIFDRLVDDMLNLCIKNRPYTGPVKGFRCGTFVEKKKISSPTSPKNKHAEYNGRKGGRQTTVTTDTDGEIDSKERRRMNLNRLSQFINSHSRRGTMVNADGRRASVHFVDHTIETNSAERRKIIDNYTYVNHDQLPLPHCKQLLYDLQLRINSHKAHS